MAVSRIAAAVPGLNGQAPSALLGTGTRVNATAASTSTAAAVVPVTGALTMVRVAAAGICIRFGASGVAAAAVDANSIMMAAPGDYLVHLASTDTHFRVIRTGSADVAVQLEALSAQ